MERALRTLLVTSEATFVPRNYNRLVCGLAECSHIAGLLVLDNGGRALAFRGIGLMCLGAPRIGRLLFLHACGAGRRERQRAFSRAKKPVFHLPAINVPRAVELVNELEIDLILNARTRHIYREAILEAPPLGCINIHHGLLPEQRGTMCDLWALFERQAAGFTIHQMNAKIDAGRILRRVEVSDGTDRDYPAYLLRSSGTECAETAGLLEDIARTRRIEGETNCAPPGLAHRRNPTREQIKMLRAAGLLL